MNLQLGCWPGVDDPEFSALLDRRLERLSPGQLAVLREMRAALSEERLEDSEILANGLVTYLGLRRVSARTVHALVSACCINTADDMADACTRYYRITSTGLEMLARRERAYS